MTRNRFRNLIVPAMIKENPRFLAHMTAWHEQLSDLLTFSQNSLAQLLAQMTTANQLQLAKYRQQPQSSRRLLMLQWLKNQAVYDLTQSQLMQIDQYADRMPERLSGGQQQRVALARALCIEPDVLLMDEPLSNLDAKLRVEMRTVIKNIQHNVGITTVYVTHDQEEAMAVSDRIAVMNAGVIQQIGTPKAIYQRPANLFVSTFIGRSNILNGTLEVEGGKTYVVTKSGYKAEIKGVRDEQKKNQNVVLSVRPEEFLLDRGATAGIGAVVDDCVFLGLNTHYFVHLSSGEEVEIIQESSIDSIIEPGSHIKLTLNTEKLNVFTEDGSENILTGVHNDRPES